MELYQIKQFVAVAETGSFTKAAVRSAVTQPSISAAISKLEQELGQKLFDRRQGSVVPTVAGNRLLTTAREILQACSSIKSDLRSGVSSETLRLGVLRTLPTSHIASIIETFRKAHPHVIIELFEGAHDELESRLSQGKLHLLLTSVKSREPRGKSHVLFTEPYFLIANAAHRFAKMKSICLEDLKGEPFILRTGCETFRDTTALFITRGIRTRIVYRTDQDDRALGLIAAGIGVALMPALYHYPGTVNIPISDFEITRTIGLRWHSQPTKNLNMEAMIAFARGHEWKMDTFSGEKRKSSIKLSRSDEGRLMRI